MNITLRTELKKYRKDNTLKIRRATTGDEKRVLELLIQVDNVHADIRPDLFIHDSTKYDEKSLREIFKDDTRPIFVYVNDEGELCGYAFCMMQEIDGNNLVAHKSVYIDDICVDENHRREHVATALYEYVKDFAVKEGCYNITLNVWEGNDSARNFYEKCGMTVQKTVMEQIL